MTLIEIFNKYAWVGVVKKLLAGGVFTTDRSGKDAGNVIAELTNLANTLGLYTPARDVFLDYFYGTDTALSAALTAGSANNGLALDMREINPNARSIVIQAGTGTALDYDYEIFFSRNGLIADAYTTGLTGTAIATEFLQVNLPASEGYDQYVHLVITPDGAQSGAQLTFRGYLTGKGG